MLKRKNPVNVNFRRDVGVWCGITGVFHGLISFTLYNSGNLLSYFLSKNSSGGYSFEFNLNALSNIVGVLALLIMAVLLVTSNNLSMRYLKGKSWKFVQRFNYPLFILVVAHTIGYLVLNLRESFFTFLLVALVIFTLLAQLVGILITVQRENTQAKEAVTRQIKKTPTLTEDDFAQNRLARRRFLILAGTTLVAGLASGTALTAAILKENNNSNSNATTQASVSNTPSAVATATSASGNSGTTATNPTTSAATVSGAGSSNGGTDSTGTSATSSTVASGSSSAATATTAVTAATTNGTKITSLSSLPTNSAINFTTPDTKETTLVIHEADGTVKAFSNICTHRPYNLVYQSNTQTLFCALHSANFDARTGAVLNGPPKTALTSFNVQVDAQGNVVYIQS
jgi:nitrite reductase/ring-hydroxylating ferredoxin subunit/DMSO/TMAO reductase YedYZ heme-binding membrane subunit